MPEPRPPFDDDERDDAPDARDDAWTGDAPGRDRDDDEPDDADEDARDEQDDEERDDDERDDDEQDDDEQDDEEQDDDVLDLPEGAQKMVFVSTAIPVLVSVAPLDDERAPDGSALGTYIGERLVARCAMPREAVERLLELDLFGEPVPLALLAVEEEPGLQCRLFALIPAERIADADADDEPWRASVPSFEDSLADDDEDDDADVVGAGGPDEDDDEEDDEDDPTVASILLGHIVRFSRDRKFADDLTAEAVDVLQKIVVGGPLLDANAKAIDDLLDSL